MVDINCATKEELADMRKWFFKENVRIQQEKQNLEQERRELENQKRDFKIEQNSISIGNRMEKRQLDQERKLFEMKWKILQEETFRLAEEKRQMERERAEYMALKETRSETPRMDIFFVGVNSSLSLKKRYKDLIKIFHPDNMNGDTATLQAINQEYDSLSRIFV